MSSVNILIDDTDPRITYDGPWFSAPGPTDDIGFYGAVWNKTLHATHANASLSFKFEGIWVVLYTTSMTPAGLTGPRYQCFVDGVPQTIVGIADSTGPTNHWSTCGNDALADGPHTFTVNVTVSANQTAWVDFIKYSPSTDVSLDGETVLVQNFSPDVKVSAGWAALPVSDQLVNPWSSSTNVTGSTLSYDFIGTSLIWYALATVYVPNIPAACTYTIDGGSPVPFKTVGLSSRNPTQNEFFVILFQVDSLSLGPHTLDVVYNGRVNDTPLILDYLVIQNGTAHSLDVQPVGTGTTATNAATPTNDSAAQTQSPASNGNKHINVGAIVGGVCGTVALIIFAILSLLFLRRRQKRQRLDTSQPHAFPISQRPFAPSFVLPHDGTEQPQNSIVISPAINDFAVRPTVMSEVKRPLPVPRTPLLSASSGSSSSRHALAESFSANENGYSARAAMTSQSHDSKRAPMRDSNVDDMPPMYTPD